ncbi:hypothetical protein BVRB_4g078490 [Beta vulgaris subsp. vulgaris]|nr:hypothetical protein BVRB_4g078490 [Beta vulgaris subsp. vulgaris]
MTCNLICFSKYVCELDRPKSFTNLENILYEIVKLPGAVELPLKDANKDLVIAFNQKVQISDDQVRTNNSKKTFGNEKTFSESKSFSR